MTLLTMASAGCQAVLAQHPIGVRVNESLNDKLDGVWQTDDGKYIFFVKADSGGVLEVAGIEWQKGKFGLLDTSCIVTTEAGWNYLNVPLPPDSLGRQFFLFAPIVEDGKGETMTVFMPSAELFNAAIQKKELTGESVVQPFEALCVEDQTHTFFKAQTAESVRSSEAYILKRTRKGKIDVAWPPNQ